MKNLKKVGLSALAGSLVAFSANAVEMGVTGTAEVTYTTSGGAGSLSTGNPWGSNTAISFTGEGDVGFGTAKIVRTLQDGANHATQTGDNFVSAWQTVDMGALGKLSFDSAGGGLEGVTAYDDMLPSAYEEVWNGVGSGTSHNLGAASNDTLGYSNSFGAFGISLATTKGGTRATGDGGNGGTLTSTKKDWVITLDGSMLMDGLSGGIMSHVTDYTAATSDDDTIAGGWINYSTGPVSVGYRASEVQSGTGGTAGKNVEAYAIAYNVNDNMSISVATQDVEYDNTGAAATNVTETIDAFNASYTMGAASVRASFSEADNDAGTTSVTDEHMEISLILSF